jgi:hypothetical protein
MGAERPGGEQEIYRYKNEPVAPAHIGIDDARTCHIRRR